ncbi:hypothetical protein [Gardnerella vaginalis]|uniref:Adhesin domain-containing protein n=1 Tax=Gardnerella vaginalis TaxID=2702 RepID=A0AAW6Y2D3_GARVA|nr:hypothetical protein [Gardnerella vaginalis]RFT39500.1 hypothetical protein CG397_06360 [Gardnerella vaginalis]
MADSRKFVAKTKDVSLAVRRADSFSISYVNCEKDVFGIDENQDGIKLVQTEKVSAFYWLHWLAKGSPEVIVSLPESVDFCEIEAESNQVLVTDIKADKIYSEVHNGRVEARNVQANDVFLKCLNGSAVANNVKVVDSCMVDTLNGTSVLEGEIPKDACLEVVCENGVAEVCDKHKADFSCNNLGFETDECAHYVVHCLNGKAVVK